MAKRILVTGGAGYIGSHTVVELLQSGYDVTILDNLSNSSGQVLERIEQITKRKCEFVLGDARDKNVLGNIFAKNDIYAVVHFAGHKAVGESVKEPLSYYNNNLYSAIATLEVMQKEGCKNFLFSSSATVYSSNESLPFTEESKLMPSNPYGMTKLMIEYILRDLFASDNNWNIAILRYFNPIGAHSSGLIGENPKGIPNNLLPYISNVAFNKAPHIRVFGNDYNTPDGTGRRDYIHVVDLALGHIAALNCIEGMGLDIFNLGTGKSYSVLEIISAYEKALGKSLPKKIEERRAGDIAECYADCTKAKKKLNFVAQKSLQEMCLDSIKYSKMNS